MNKFVNKTFGNNKKCSLFVHLTNCVDNVDDEKRTPAEKKDSHNDAHLYIKYIDDEDNDMTPFDDNYHGDNDHNAASLVWSSFR